MPRDERRRRRDYDDYDDRPRKKRPLLSCGGVIALALVGCCVVSIVAGLFLNQQAKSEIADADKIYDTGNKQKAVAVYKRNFHAIHDTDQPERLKRIVETELEGGNAAIAKEWVERGIKSKIPVNYQSRAAKDIATEAAKEIQVAEAKAEADRKAEDERRAADRKKADAVDQPNPDEVNVNGLVLLKQTVKGVQNEFSMEITGTVVNRRAATLGYAQITFNVYDSTGAQVGSALANINGLEPGGRWNFKAVSLSKGKTYKFSALSGF